MRRSTRLLEKQYIKDSQMNLDEYVQPKNLKQTKINFKSVHFNSDIYEYDSDNDVIMICGKCNITINKCNCSK